MHRTVWLLAGLAVLALVVGLWGCSSTHDAAGTEVDTAAKPPPAPTPTPSKLIYWNFTQLKPSRVASVFTSYTNGSGAVQIAADAIYPSWSPLLADGKPDIAYNINRTIYTAQHDGTLPTVLTTDGWFPEWSPAGDQIAFQRPKANGTGYVCCVIPAGGGAVVELTEGEDPNWSPDGNYLVFNRYLVGLMVIPLAEGDPYPVKDPEALPGGGILRLSGGGPDWSANGRIAFISGTDSSVSCIAVDATGHAVGERQVLYPRSTGFLRHPRWSPDATQLVFSKEYWKSSTSVTETLYSYNVATGTATAIGNGASPDWSSVVTEW